MKIELQQKLIKEFDFIKKSIDRAKKNSYFIILISFGFEVGNGWFSLIWKLCEDLRKLNFNGYIEQVKEKFGGLRFYVSNATDEQYKIIHKAENKSYKICEKCGKKGKLTKEGWLITLCRKHRKERKRQIKERG